MLKPFVFSNLPLGFNYPLQLHLFFYHLFVFKPSTLFQTFVKRTMTPELDHLDEKSPNCSTRVRFDNAKTLAICQKQMRVVKSVVNRTRQRRLYRPCLLRHLRVSRFKAHNRVSSSERACVCYTAAEARKAIENS